MRRALLSLLMVAFVLAGTATAAAQNPIDDYRRNGTIDPCKYSDGQLRRGSGNLPPDVEQYAPGLADALNQGREGCGGGAPGGADTRQDEAVPVPATPGRWGSPQGSGAPSPRQALRSRRRPPPSRLERSAAGQLLHAGGDLQARLGTCPAGSLLLRWSLAAAAVVAVVRADRRRTPRD